MCVVVVDDSVCCWSSVVDGDSCAIVGDSSVVVGDSCVVVGDSCAVVVVVGDSYVLLLVTAACT